VDAYARTLSIGRFSVFFRLLRPLALHDFSGPMVRGAFGHALAHLPERTISSADRDWLFGPIALGGPQSPRPFRVRTGFGLRRTLHPGEVLEVQFDLFGAAQSFLPAAISAWRAAGRSGFGPRRAASELIGVAQDLPTGEKQFLGVAPDRSIPAPFEFWAVPVGNRAVVQLETPTALKDTGAVRPPNGERIQKAAERRLQSVSEVCGTGMVAGIEVLPLEEEWLSLSRQVFGRSSSRSGDQRIEGWVGMAVVRGPMGVELARLCAAIRLLGIGRGTAFGMGQGSGWRA
jgi:hypothetical protein